MDKTINLIKNIVLTWICFAGALTLTACGSGPLEEAKLIPPSVQPATPPVAVRPIKPTTSIESDACGAKDLAYLVGKHRTEIPIPLHPEKRRVLCSTCAATMDFSPNRQNIVFDTKTGIIKSVTCG
jgi:hypothetical protein